MANYVFGARTVCPFYQKEAKKSITCEGFVEGTLNMTRFASQGKKNAYQRACCDSFDYDKRCPLAAALMQKYEE